MFDTHAGFPRRALPSHILGIAIQRSFFCNPDGIRTGVICTSAEGGVVLAGLPAGNHSVS